uniref:CUB domain-containing protein n=1 Tax=Panagrellus redivivus TaxID=6233 RepID=A0A7E4VW58_PANRE
MPSVLALLETYAFDPYYRWQDKKSTCFAWLKTEANNGWVVVDRQTPLPFICQRHVAYGTDVYQNGTSGTLTSPKYPIPYEPDVTSFYYISVSLGNVVDLTFNFLGIDSDSLINVYDGWTENSTILKTITNTYRSNMIESTSNLVMLEFVASGSSGGRYFGWSASYRAIVPRTLTGGLLSSNYPLNANNNENVQLDILFYLWDFQSYGSATLTIYTSDGNSTFLNFDTDYQTNKVYRLDNADCVDDHGFRRYQKIKYDLGC